MNSNIIKENVDVVSDVESYFRAHDLISGGVQTKGSLHTIQTCFNEWQQQCDLSLSQLSRLLAFATGDNNVQIELSE